VSGPGSNDTPDDEPPPASPDKRVVERVEPEDFLGDDYQIIETDQPEGDEEPAPLLPSDEAEETVHLGDLLKSLREEDTFRYLRGPGRRSFGHGTGLDDDDAGAGGGDGDGEDGDAHEGAGGLESDDEEGDDGDAGLIIHYEDGFAFDELPVELAAAAAPAPKIKPSQEARYTNLVVLDGTDFKISAEPLLDAPLIAGHQYSLQVSVWDARTGIAVVGPDEPLRPIDTKDPVDLFVVVAPVEDSDWEVIDPIQPLHLSKERVSEDPASFFILPTTNGQEGRRDLLIKIYYRLNLIDSLVFSPRIKVGKRPPLVEDAYPNLHFRYPGFPERFAEIDPSLAPKQVNISVRRDRPDRWRVLIVLETVEGRLPLTGYASLSNEQMLQITNDVRQAWDTVITDPRVYDTTTRAMALAEGVQTLAAAGRKAWNGFVGSGGTGRSLYAIGQMLENNPPAPGASIQIMCEETAVDFILPWALFYSAPEVLGAKADISDFWGFRYEFEIRNPSTLTPPKMQAPSCIAFGSWRSGAATRQQAMLAALQQRFPQQISVIQPAIESGVDFLAALMQIPLNCLYVLAHGYTRVPGLSNIAALSAWFSGKYTTAAQPPPELAALVENLAEIKLNNLDDWIKLTKSTLTLTQMKASRAWLRNKPIVFLNMCHSAQINPGLSDGFVGFFLQRGASAVLGTECPIPPFVAESFAADVFDNLSSGSSLGRAVYQARMRSKALGNPLTLAYSLYGRADSRLL
jgi:hypothetical protein